jgi:hypothetical protein
MKIDFFPDDDPLDTTCHDCGGAPVVERLWRPMGRALVASDLCASCVQSSKDGVTFLLGTDVATGEQIPVVVPKP